MSAAHQRGRARVVGAALSSLLLACSSSERSSAGALPSSSVALLTPNHPGDEARRLRLALVAELEREGRVTDDRVLEVMAATPRHLFTPDSSLRAAYLDEPRPIGWGQTISQPTIVGAMTQALELTGGERVLEIGTGSGYQAAILSQLAKHVFTIELLEPLGQVATQRLADLGHANVQVRVGDGYAGWPEQAPFDRILVTAAPPELPQALTEQLAEGGILVVPVGDQGETQRLLRIRKVRGALVHEDLGGVRFVPMVPGSK